MTPQDTLHAEAACRRLSLEFALHNDTAAYEKLTALFTPDGVLYRPLAPDVPLAGRAAILEDMRRKPADVVTHHVCTNILINLETPEQAIGCTYFTVYLQAGVTAPATPYPFSGTTYIGHYRDRYCLTPDGWKIAERRGRNQWTLPKSNTPY